MFDWISEHLLCTIFLVLVVWTIISTVRSANKQQAQARPDNDLLHAIRAGKARSKIVEQERNEKRNIPPHIKEYVTQLCEVYYTNNKNFADSNTVAIGEKINKEGGDQMMLEVHQRIKMQLGPAAARDLEYKWSGIGKWMG